MKRIGILGGSFNPPQNGHVAIAQYVLDRRLVDEVCVMPCADHPYAKELAPFADRIAMCTLAFHGMKHVAVSDLEAHLPLPSYTVQTLKYLRKEGQRTRDEKTSDQRPASGGAGHEFYLIIGSDIATDIPQWKDGAEIPRLAKIIEIPRGPTSPIPNVSATEVRRCIHAGRGIIDQVPVPVAEYIQFHGLYRQASRSLP